MIQFDFDEQIARLKKAYGQQANDEFVAVLWKKFGRLEKRVFAEAVDFMVEERAALKVSVLSEAINARARRFSQPLDFNESLPDCSVCKNAATMFAKSKSGGHKIFIRCHCEWGGKVGDDALPQWKPALRQEFDLVPVPMLRPDLSSLRDDHMLAALTDDDFFRHPKVQNHIQRSMHTAIEWWAAQKNIAREFWAEYFAEGLAR